MEVELTYNVVEDREAERAAVHGVTKSNWATEQQTKNYVSFRITTISLVNM